MTPEDKKKALVQLNALEAYTERFFGMKTLVAWQCLYCGHIMDNMEIAVMHPNICEKKKEMRKKNEQT